MYCTKCGRELPDGVELCTQCYIPTESGEQGKINPVQKEDNTSKIKNNRLPLYFSIIACIILILSTLLPFVSIKILGLKTDIALIKGDGKIFIAIALISLFLSFMKKYIGVIVMGVLSVAFSFLATHSITHTNVKTDNDFGFSIDYSALIHKEIGFYLMFLGSILIFAVGIYGLLLKKGLLQIKK